MHWFHSYKAWSRALAACQNSKQVGVLQKEVVSLRVQLAAFACTSYRPGGGAQLAELQEQLALAEDDHDRRLVAREQRHISPSSASEQAGKALTCAAGPRAFGPAQELFTEPLNRAKEEEKWVSFLARGLSITLDQICVLTRPVLLSCCS